MIIHKNESLTSRGRERFVQMTLNAQTAQADTVTLNFALHRIETGKEAETFRFEFFHPGFWTFKGRGYHQDLFEMISR